jgi:hypothetical protein
MMAPSSVLRRINDQLVAPRASRGELLVAYATALSGVVLATALAADAGLSALPLVVVAVVAFDLFGGAVVNATAAAKRRFHGPGPTWRHHLGFVPVHVQPFVLALVVPGFGWVAAAIIYGLAWFAPVLFVKLPLGHLLPGAAARPWAPASSGG